MYMRAREGDVCVCSMISRAAEKQNSGTVRIDRCIIRNLLSHLCNLTFFRHENVLNNRITADAGCSKGTEKYCAYSDTSSLVKV